MDKYITIFLNSFSDYFGYVKGEFLFSNGKLWYENYVFWLLAISVFFWLLEIVFPWRKNQSIVRKDFWLDGFYMFFNFFLFSLVGYNAISNVFVELFNDFLGFFGITNLVAIEVNSWAVWQQLLLMFVLRDFIQWNVHRLLHRSDFLWQFHKVHHSVKQMGFAAHLRFHWMETVVYRSIEYIPLAMIGFGLDDFLIVHIIALAIGHFNHSNFRLNLGPLKYIFNNPQMHIWHHAKKLPKERRYGVNFGLSLSIWDYIFGSNYIPSDGRDIELGFDGDETFPESFITQEIYPLSKK